MLDKKICSLDKHTYKFPSEDLAPCEVLYLVFMCYRGELHVGVLEDAALLTAAILDHFALELAYESMCEELKSQEITRRLALVKLYIKKWLDQICASERSVLMLVDHLAYMEDCLYRVEMCPLRPRRHTEHHQSQVLAAQISMRALPRVYGKQRLRGIVEHTLKVMLSILDVVEEAYHNEKLLVVK